MEKESTIKHIEYHMKLIVEDLNSDVLNKWVSTIPDKKITVIKYKKIPKSFLYQYCTILSSIENHMPDEPGNDEVLVKPDDITNEENIISYLIMINDDIIGISRFFINREDSQNIYQGQIGIHYDYYGRGYAKYLLGSSYLEILKSNTNIRNITVDTHPSNEVMIYLLEKIGFKYTHTEKIYK